MECKYMYVFILQVHVWIKVSVNEKEGIYMCTKSINHSDDFWNEDANDFLFAGDRSKGRFYPHLLQFHIFFRQWILV